MTVIALNKGSSLYREADFAKDNVKSLTTNVFDFKGAFRIRDHTTLKLLQNYSTIGVM